MARYDRKDSFYRRAKREQFAARSVYKLEEIDQRFHVLKKGARVVDLGCAPGSWLQYAGSVVAPTGFVLGYDLAPVTVSAGPRVITFVTDVLELTPERIRADAAPFSTSPSLSFDVLLSDLAPKTTGIRDADQARSIGLVEKGLELARDLVVPGGAFVAKVFQGSGFDELLRTVRAAYEDVKVLKPEATRQGSREAFIIAKRKRGTPPVPAGS